MDIIKAAQATEALVEYALSGDKTLVLPFFHHSHFGIIHIVEMLHKIEKKEIVGEQAHRWLGWVQCAVCVHGFATLEELKSINHGS